MIKTIAPLPFKIYSIEDHPNKPAVYDWIRDNWRELGEFHIKDMLFSLHALAKTIGGNLDYSFCIVPQFGQFIKITDFDAAGLSELVADDCPLTGGYYDSIVIEGLKANTLDQDALKALHASCPVLNSEKGLKRIIELNYCYFTSEGSAYSGCEVAA